METKRPLLAFAFVVLGLAQTPTTQAQTTAFTYQGRLNDGGNPANGKYDASFLLFDAATNGNQVGSALTNNATSVSNGIFTVQLDFGSGVFTGAVRWLEIAVRTNGTSAFTTLTPRQQLTPTPYAISAQTAGILSGPLPAAQLSGAVGNGQLANSSITLNAGTGLSGGGAVALGSATTLNNSGILSVTGNSDITASTLNGAVTLGSTATSDNTPGTIIKRDASGDFSGGTLTLSGVLNLPAPATISSGGSPLLRADSSLNFFVGPGAGNPALSGNQNTGMGRGTLQNNTSGSNNTASGFAVMNSNTTGNNNTASGSLALHFNTSGNNNTAYGFEALFFNTTGSDNTAHGYVALVSNTNGRANTAVGYAALLSNTSGSENTASGASALRDNTTGDNNTASGYAALASNTTGRENTASGNSALRANTTGNNNTANGYAALNSNTTGDNNTASGYAALNRNTSGNQNTASGVNALYQNTTGNANAASGYAALGNNTDGSANTANGFGALNSNTNGNSNTASGYAALNRNTSGSLNTASGTEALYFNTNGSFNIALGYLAGQNLTTGSSNIFIGNQGIDGDNNQIRIGTSGTHTNVSIAGIYGAPIASGVPVVVTASGQLGVATSLNTVEHANLILTRGETVASIDFHNGKSNIFDARLSLESDNILKITGADLIIGNSTFGGHYANLSAPGGFPVLDFRNDLAVEYDARFILYADDTLALLGASLHVEHSASVCTLTIRGGCDLAEPFQMSDKEIPKGAVVVIDENNAGHLKMSNRACDRRVAGIISGANGINTGVTLTQEGVFDNGQNVALSGRVYVQADAGNGPIVPGDLLTTSDVPGHAMKVTDHAKAQGAILGKAMSALKEGKGMVLVLVSLQ